VSDYKESSIRRRDERRTLIPEPIRPPSGSSKNTKRWCRGKVGREHKPVCRNYADDAGTIFKGWKILVCESCGKHLEYYFPGSWGKRNPVKPAWVCE
jgi:hypothetical protein